MAASDISAQLSAFLQAPIPYIAEAILVAGLVWMISRAFSRDTIEALRERLSLATDRLQKATEEAAAARESLTKSQPETSRPSRADAIISKLIQSNNDALKAIAAARPKK